jgi:hypothetical protein
MKQITLSIWFLISFCAVFSQETKKQPPTIQIKTGLANVNYKQIKNAIQSGFNLYIPFKSKLSYVIGYDYLLGSHITKDDRSAYPQIFNYNSHLQKSQINGLASYPILNYHRFEILVQTGLSLNFIKQSFVNNIYKKEIFPNEPLVLVSESTFEKKFQIGSTSAIQGRFKFKKVSPGIALQYQFQKEYQFFSPTIFLSYQL